MNGFRVTILVLFSLTVVLMAYAVTVVIPGQRAEYEVYTAQQSSNAYRQRHEEHRARMDSLRADRETPEVETARTEAEEGERRRRQEINEAEENSVLAAARRKEEERAAREAEEQAAAPAVLGRVVSYNAEWTSILFIPEGATPLPDGLALDIYRGNQLVCEAVVDGRDEESGQVSAAVKPVVLSSHGGAPVQQMTPAPGDTVVASALMLERPGNGEAADFSAAVQQMEQGGYVPQTPAAPADAAGEGDVPALEPIPTEGDGMPAEGSTPAAAMPVQTTQLPAFPTTDNRNGLPEIDAQLVPVP